MKACIYNSKKAEIVKKYTKKEMYIFLPTSAPRFSKNPFVEIILSDRKTHRDMVIDIPVSEIKKLIKK